MAFRRLEQDALERATGCSPAELSYVKDDIDRLKGTAAELCAEAAFMECACVFRHCWRPADATHESHRTQRMRRSPLT